MILSTSSYIRPGLCALALWLLLGGCAGGPAVEKPPRIGAALRVAVLPIDNMGGVPAPLEEIHRDLVLRLKGAGVDLISGETMQAFINRHRLRYLGGIEQHTAEALRAETGAQAVLITSLEFYNAATPPKVALTFRLVSTGETLDILWIDGFGLAGDDHPGFLELGLVEEPTALLGIGLDRMVFSLARHLDASKAPSGLSSGSFLPPDTAYRDTPLISTAGRRVAVLPFLNLSRRKYAGDIMSLHFLNRLAPYPDFHLLEPGMVRQSLLEGRIVMGDGISLADAQLLFSRLDVDLILTGRVLEYEDYQGNSGTTRVCFSAVLLERESRKVAWNAQSCNNGDQGVWFFDFGKHRTAHDLAGAMAQGAVQSLLH
jgi:hypothetical protein